jgi:hypothetical protein
MNIFTLLICIFQGNKIIQNIDVPACKNCIYYKTNNFENDFTSPFNKCEKFGEKDIITDKITYNSANYCRIDETKCGKEGKFFEEEKNIKLKIFNHNIISNMPYRLPILFIIINLFLKVVLQR